MGTTSRSIEVFHFAAASENPSLTALAGLINIMALTNKMLFLSAFWLRTNM
jgi:hypothetical protein